MKKNIVLRLVVSLVAFLVMTGTARAQVDTIYVSDIFSTHVMFPTDLVYVDVSNRQVVSLKVVEQNKNMFGIKAREPFEVPTSVSALESNGRMHTWIVLYKQNPSELVIDLRTERSKESCSTAAGTQQATPVQGGASSPVREKRGRERRELKGRVASTWKGGDAPLLQDVLAFPRELYHLGASGYGITVSCDNIYSYSDITYIVLSVKNTSGISYNITDATFVVESKKFSKRKAATERPIFFQSRYGNLSAAPGGEGRIAYSLDKLSLSKDQVLRVYFYEEGGQRDLVMTLSMKDVNKAKNTLEARR